MNGAGENGKEELIKFLKERCQNEKGISFESFMEQALYHPLYGYYASGEAEIGRKGDFFTSVSVGPLYGELLAFQFVEMWERLGSPKKWDLVEQGAHHGQLSVDVLKGLKSISEQAFGSCRFTILEPFEKQRVLQQAKLEAEGLKAKWVKSFEEISSVEGVWFSNELVDSFPVHRLVWEKGAWWESWVVWRGEKFDWELTPLALGRLVDVSATLPLPTMEPYVAEVSLHACDWMKRVAQTMQRGFVLTVDYGFEFLRLYHPERAQGTLQTYHAHRKGDDPLEHVGQQDITTHVDFTALIEAGAEAGLKALGFTDQHHFLVGLGTTLLETRDPTSPAYQKKLRAFRTLMHPEMMGTAFQCLIQSKNVEVKGNLRGLQFSQ